MKRAVAAAVVLATLTSSASAQALTDRMKALTEKWNAPTEPFAIMGNIHYVGTNGLSSFLITTPDGHILIDTGLPEANPQIKASIAKLGFKVSDIRILLNTHAHFDHTGGLADFKKETGAQMIAGERDKPLLEGGYYPGRPDDKERGFPAVKVDRTVKEGDKVTLGGVTLTANATPGHSPGCTSWSWTVADGSATRSVLLFCSATVALNQLVGKPTHPGIVDDYRKTFAWAKTQSPEVFLAPHPEMFGMHDKRAAMAAGRPNPFAKAGDFTAFAARLETAFEAALAKQTAALGEKK
jgi:metallo-beta-lactamase class B